MTDASVQDHGILLHAPELKTNAPMEKIIQVAREYSVSPFRQFGQMVRYNLAAPKASLAEYYQLGLFDKDIPHEDKLRFVGEKRCSKLNVKINRYGVSSVRPIFRDKLLMEMVLRGTGHAIAKTRAFVHPARKAGLIPSLTNRQEILDFLRDNSNFPLFGKPLQSSWSDGTVQIDRAEGYDLQLGNGKVVKAEELASEILNRYPLGYLFQEKIRQHEAINALTGGSAVGTIRLVTLDTGDGPQFFYAVWKIPAQGAMADSFWQPGSVAALLSSNGQVEVCRKGRGLGSEFVTDHLVTGNPLIGFQLPFWQEAIELACNVHSVFPGIGLVGYDMAISENGPVIIEANLNPGHTLYQNATGKPFMSDEHAGKLDTAMEHISNFWDNYKEEAKLHR